MTQEVSILLVEDNNIDAEAITRAIRKRKIANKIVHVHNGAEAIEALGGEPGVPEPRIILLDMNMPRMNGVEFLQHIRNDPRYSREVVLVLTTSNLDQDKIAAYNLNIAGYVLKDNVGEDFEKLLNLFHSYRRIVEFPV